MCYNDEKSSTSNTPYATQPGYSEHILHATICSCTNVSHNMNSIGCWV